MREQRLKRGTETTSPKAAQLATDRSVTKVCVACSTFGKIVRAPLWLRIKKRGMWPKLLFILWRIFSRRRLQNSISLQSDVSRNWAVWIQEGSIGDGWKHYLQAHLYLWISWCILQITVQCRKVMFVQQSCLNQGWCWDTAWSQRCRQEETPTAPRAPEPEQVGAKRRGQREGVSSAPSCAWPC